MPENDGIKIDATSGEQIANNVADAVATKLSEALQPVLSEFTQKLESASSSVKNSVDNLSQKVADVNLAKAGEEGKEAAFNTEKLAKIAENEANVYGNTLNPLGQIASLFTPQKVADSHITVADLASDDKFGLGKKLALQAAFQGKGVTQSALSAGRVAGMYGGMALGGTLATAAGAGAIVAAIAGVQAIGKQIWTTLKENLSPAQLAKNFANAMQAEFMAGNFRSGDRRGFNLTDYTQFRNEMRKLGVRDDQAIANSLSEIVKQGIVGGVAFSDAVNAALSQQAIKRTLGLDINSDAIGSLYRATQSDRGMFGNAYGDFDLQRFAQNFGNLAKASENVRGVQVSIQEWYNIFNSLKDRFRGTDVDFANFQRGLVRFGKAITDNVATVGDVNALYKQASAGLSNSSMFKMFALMGTTGGDLLDDRLRFIRRGLSDNVGINALQIARYLRHYGDITGGSDTARRDLFMREELEKMGLGTVARSVANLDKFFGSIVSGDREQAEKFDELAKDTNTHLMDQAHKLDLLRNPVEHIRDLLFGIVSSKLLWFLGGADFLLNKGTEVISDITKDGSEYSKSVRERRLAETSEKQLAENKTTNQLLAEVVANTQQKTTTQTTDYGQPD